MNRKSTDWGLIIGGPRGRLYQKAWLNESSAAIPLTIYLSIARLNVVGFCYSMDYRVPHEKKLISLVLLRLTLKSCTYLQSLLQPWLWILQMYVLGLDRTDNYFLHYRSSLFNSYFKLMGLNADNNPSRSTTEKNNKSLYSFAYDYITWERAAESLTISISTHFVSVIVLKMKPKIKQ